MERGDSWSLPSRLWNRLMHALHGNIVVYVVWTGSFHTRDQGGTYVPHIFTNWGCAALEVALLQSARQTGGAAAHWQRYDTRQRAEAALVELGYEEWDFVVG